MTDPTSSQEASARVRRTSGSTRIRNLPRFAWISLAAASAAVLVVVIAWALNAPRQRIRVPGIQDLVEPTVYEPMLGGPGGSDGNPALAAPQFDMEVIRESLRSGVVIMQDVDPPPPGMLLVADFDKDGVTDREFAAPTGTWLSDPRARVRLDDGYDTVQRWGSKGFGLRLVYDLTGDGIAHGGYWIQFRRASQSTLDLSQFRILSLMLKSGTAGGTSRIRVDIKSPTSRSSVTVAGIGHEWQEFTVPLASFHGVTDWSHITELALVLDPAVVDRRAGTLFVDDVMFGQ